VSRMIKMIVEYDGTDFYGWQVQPDLRTVQGEIEKALSALTQQSIRITGSGRTDTGVHAFGQVFNFVYDGKLGIDRLKKGLNAILSKDIRIHHAEVVLENFDARRNAVSRMYRYVITKTERAIGRQYAWYPSFDYQFNKMRLASQYLLGEHEWSAFAKPRADSEPLTSTVFDVQWHDRDTDYYFEIIASRFFHSMIRLIIGTLMDVGRGVITPERFKSILDSGDLNQAGAKAPACGLYLIRVEYP